MPAIRFPLDNFTPITTQPVFFHPLPTLQTAFTGTGGNDTLSGTAGNDTFDLSQGGNDTANGLAGNDVFTMGAALNALDQIDGGTGTDFVELDGDYSAGLTFKPTTMVNVESLILSAGFSYKLTTNDATVASAATLTVNGTALGSGDVLTFNGALETDGAFVINGGAAADFLTGGAGSDTVAGRDGNDTINLSYGGDDIANGGNDNDTFIMGGAMTSADQINGGPGADVVVLNGDYSSGLSFGATTMLNVETLRLTAGHSYHLVTSDATVAAGQTLTVNGSTLGLSDSLTFEGDQETNGTFHLTGGASDDFFFMGGAMTAADHINGGGVSLFGNQISLDGDYSGTHSLTFAAPTIANIQEIALTAGHSYTLTTNDANVASGQHLQIYGLTLGSTDVLTFDGAAETDGTFEVDGGAGNDVITGGAGGDTIYLAAGGNDTANGGGGNDNFFFGGALTAADRVDGGAGTDTVELSGEYTGKHALTLAANTIANVETIKFDAGSNYTLTMNDGDVASGNTLFVNALALHYGSVLNFDGSAETDGRFFINGGAGNDFLIGGDGADTISGGAGSDQMEGGGGANVFFFGTVTDSSGPTYDTVVDFDASRDFFAVPTVPTAVIGAITFGALSQASFDSDLAAAVGALPGGQAVLFQPDSGDLAGETYLVVDQNGSTGYQSGQDLVIHLLNAGGIGTITTSNFELAVT